MSIELKNISYTYSKGTPFVKQGIKDLSLSIKDGEWIVVMGSSGSGKSTFLQHLNGLLKPDTGTVLVDGQDIHSTPANIKEARRKVGFVFQYPEHQLFGGTIYEEIAYGPENYGFTKEQIEILVKNSMETVGLSYDLYKDRSPHELSGGEKRRVALAGVLATKPSVITLDEPTAGLDALGKEKLFDTIYKLNKEHGITVIWVTHELTRIAAVANRLLVINKGEIVLNEAIRNALERPIIKELGLDVPLAVEIAHMLKNRGKTLDGQPVTLEEIKNEIIKMKMKK